MDDETALAAARRRQATYLVLSTLFSTEVTSEFLKRACENPPVTEGVLGAYFASLAPATIEDARTEAAADFAACLLGMSVNPVHPYESVYTSDLRLLMQEAYGDVRRFYSSQGFGVDEDIALPDDHVAFELEFMAHLCEREANALESCDAAVLGACIQAQQSFLKDHVLTWVPQLCVDLKRRARTGLYQGLAQATTLFLEEEADALL